ncbi:hypothetical protein DRJ12_04630 [Candidatus Acetothermia bacterium]|nr:MAG: hypothetical protein DRJ12_04630 [Candidatus Acetothermia bacterium]
MKGLATGLLAILLIGLATSAGPLEMAIGGGPAAISLKEINGSIRVINTVIDLLNETFAVHPDVTGSVGELDPMSSGLAFCAEEWYWLTGWFSFGGKFEYLHSSSAVSGEYHGADVSTIDVALGLNSVGLLFGGRAVFLDMGLVLAAEGGVGYYYTMFDRSVVFEIPSEYPDVISVVPSEGTGHYTGGAFGLELGLSLYYPLTSWFSIGSSISYRSGSVNRMVDREGEGLDLDGDGITEGADLDGISVQFMFSVSINLSLTEEKGVAQ